MCVSQRQGVSGTPRAALPPPPDPGPGFSPDLVLSVQLSLQPLQLPVPDSRTSCRTQKGKANTAMVTPQGGGVFEDRKPREKRQGGGGEEMQKACQSRAQRRFLETLTLKPCGVP